MHRFYVPPEDIREKKAYIKGEEMKHLSRVLRLVTGDPVVIFDGLGWEYEGVIEGCGKDEACISLKPGSYMTGESSLNVVLVQGLPKGEKMELIIQKATELGVKKIMPLMLQRSIVKLNEKKKAERLLRWQKVATEAAKQCRRTVVPKVTSVLELREFLADLPFERVLLTPWEGGGKPLKDALEEITPGKKPVYVLIGPEGGLAGEEVQAIRESGGMTVDLGPRILRTETAGLAVLANIMCRWGDLG